MTIPRNDAESGLDSVGDRATTLEAPVPGSDRVHSRRAILASALVLSASSVAQRVLAQAGRSPITRAIPHSGERLPVVGLGTAVRFSAPEDPQRDALKGVIAALIADGGKVVDTASTYGNAESVVGDIVQEVSARDRLFLSTKIEVRPAERSSEEFERSLQRLRTDRVDLIQVHNVTRPDQSLAQLRDWQAAGRCRYVGITTTSEIDYEAVEAVIRREKPDFVQVNYSIDHRSAEQRIIPAAADAGAAVLTALPFGRSSAFANVRGKPLPGWAAEIDATSWGQLFLKFLLGNPDVTAVIPGTGNPAHMADNLGAARGRLPDAPQRERIASLIVA